MWSARSVRAEIFFARGRELPVVNEGDLLAILDAGAYGMVLASNYNSRLRPAEVLVDGKSVKVIRRRETMDDLLRPEIPADSFRCPWSCHPVRSGSFAKAKLPPVNDLDIIP